MYKNIAAFCFCFILLNITCNAEDSKICKVAKDSMKAQFSRGELGFFISLKVRPNYLFLIKINQDNYQKTPVKSLKIDTTDEFKLCYNKAFQQKLDSAFKCDFFRKTDSILNAYDMLGKGYKNAEYPGGPAALGKLVDKNVSLPKEAKPNDTDSKIRVYYVFDIDEKGQISNYKLAKSNCKECEEPVLNAIKKIEKFIPATEAGKPKNVKYILPFTKPLSK
jgi:hypothetical protein